MLLVQKESSENTSCIKLIVIEDAEYPSMKALDTAMKKHPETFNEGCEYSLINNRKFLYVKPKTGVEVVQTDIFWKGDRDG